MKVMKISILILVVVAAFCHSAHHHHDHDHDHDHDHHHDHNHSHDEGVTEVWSSEDLFFYGMLAGGFVSLIGFIASFLLLFCRNFITPKYYTVIIQVLFSFSCGALLGQTMLHIVPEAYASPYLQDKQVSLTFIAAIVSFIFLERFMQKFGISDHEHWHKQQDESDTQILPQSSAVSQKRQLERQKGKEVPKPSTMKHATGYLNLISSLLHNFIDGFAIGIAFNLGNPNQFIPVTVGIIAHQIPREMGDVAILLKSKFNAKQTILSNGIVNLISLVGVYLGLNSHTIPVVVKQYILVFVAGNFLYIASDIWKNLFHHKHMLINVLQIIGLGLGVYLTLEDQHHHH